MLTQETRERIARDIRESGKFDYITLINELEEKAGKAELFEHESALKSSCANCSYCGYEADDDRYFCEMKDKWLKDVRLNVCEKYSFFTDARRKK